MAWNYSGDPAASDLDYVRYKCGDTNTLDQLLTDEEVAFEISQTDSLLKAAYNSTRAILKVLARRVNKKIGPARLDLEKQYEHYQGVLKELQTEIIEDGQGVPTQSDDIHDPIFDVGMMDNKYGVY